MKLARGGPASPRLAALLWGLGGATAAVLAGHATPASPVDKVVSLLQDLKVKLQQDDKSEQAVYDKYACWCEETTQRKAQAIEAAKTELRSLGQEILTEKGKVATLASEIQQATADIRDNEEAQQEATSIRQKENAAFLAETAELKQAVAAVEKALTVLHDATASAASSALLQRRGATRLAGASAAAASEALAAVQDALMRAPMGALEKLDSRGGQTEKLTLLRQYATDLSQGRAKYAPQSATIIGILDEMYSTFTQNLESSISAEASKNRNFEALIAAKQQELLELQAKVKKAQQDKAEAETMLAEATQSYDDTEAQLQADIKFFDVTKSGCQAKTDEWQTRKSLRTEELAGISKALEILSSDEARALFGKAIKPGVQSFMQVSSVEVDADAPARRAYQVLAQQASRAHSVRLAGLALAVRTTAVGHFEKVVLAIEGLIQELHEEEQADIQKRDTCIQDIQKIDLKAGDVEWKITVNQAKIDKLVAAIASQNAERTQTIADIQTVNDQITQMNQTRQDENAAFLAAKSDDEKAIQLLQQAKDALAAYYANNSVAVGPLEGGEGTALVQNGTDVLHTADDAPDAEFSDKGSRKHQAKGVIAILASIIEDLQGEIANGKKAEEAGQLQYEAMLAAAQALQADLTQKKVNLDLAISQREAERDQEMVAKSDNVAEQQENEAHRTEIKPDCDTAISTFDERRQKRQAEVDGLRQAKEYLAGFQPSANLLQAARHSTAKVLVHPPRAMVHVSA